MRPVRNQHRAASVGNPRHFWRDLVAAAEGLSPQIGGFQALDFKNTLIRARGVRFPCGGVSAERAALGLVETGLGFAEAGSEERREQLAPAVVAVAKALGLILAEDPTAIAQRNWNRDVD